MSEKLSTESYSQTQDSVKIESENSSVQFNLTEEDKKLLLNKYEVVVFSHDCNPESIDKKQFPYNAVLVSYVINGQVKHDHVSGPKYVKIFDAYYDLLKAAGGHILTMEQWYGMINPKQWGNKPKKEKK
jgi:hypothetical protein